jgi:hypothetical protein
LLDNICSLYIYIKKERLNPKRKYKVEYHMSRNNESSRENESSNLNVYFEFTKDITKE